jgi:hypothetical protein
MNNVLLCYTAFILEKPMKTNLKYYIFKRWNLSALICITFIIAQKFYRDLSVKIDGFYSVFGLNLKFINKLECELLNRIEFELNFTEEENKKYHIFPPRIYFFFLKIKILILFNFFELENTKMWDEFYFTYSDDQDDKTNYKEKL